MYLTIALTVVAGALFGAFLGRTQSCETGACPLTATPMRGALWGGAMGLLAGLALGPQTSRRDRADQLPLLEQEKRVTAFRENVLAHEGVALAYFGAEWCPACRTYAPEVKKVVDKAPKLGYAYVDIDAVPRLAEEWDVQAIPVTILFHEGEEVARFTGAVGAEQLRRAVEEAGEIKRAGA